MPQDSASSASALSSRTPVRRRGNTRRSRRDNLEPLVGRKHVRVISDYLATLRTLYSHPNRILFYDDVVVAYLLAFFNPSIRSLRCIEDMSQVKAVNRFLKVDALCRSTLSEANALFDPEHLQGLLEHVRRQLPAFPGSVPAPGASPEDKALHELLQRIVCFDGTFFKVAGDIQWALWHRDAYSDTRRHIRLNCMYCLKTGVPEGISISGDDGASEGTSSMALIHARETHAREARETRARETQESSSPQTPESIYLFDSGVVSFALLQDIQSRGEQFLCNLSVKVRFNAQEDKTLSQKDREAGVLSDSLGALPGSVGHLAPQGIFREIIVACSDRQGNPRQVRLLTTLLDLPALVVAQLYRYRWQIELFFRWFKVHAQFRHLMSFSRKGVTTGLYIAVLAAMLLCINSGQALDKYALNLFNAVAGGLASPEEVLPILERRARQKRLARERLERLKTQKKNP